MNGGYAIRVLATTVVLVTMLLVTSAAWAGGRGGGHHHYRDYGREGAAAVLVATVGVLLADRLREREHGHHHHIHHHWGVPSRSTCYEWRAQRASAAYHQEWARVRTYDHEYGRGVGGSEARSSQEGRVWEQLGRSA